MKLSVFKPFVVLIFSLQAALFSYGQNALQNQPQSEPWMGGEIELHAHHLIKFVSHMDFADLQRRFSFITEQVNSILADSVTRDLPLIMNNFLEEVPEEIKKFLTEGLAYNASEQAKIKLTPEFKAPSAGIILNERQMPAQDLLSQRLVVNRSEPLQAPKIIVSPSSNPHADQQYFWKIVNQRWNNIPGAQRLRMILWQKLPTSLQARLLVLLYKNRVSKYHSPADKDFKVDALEIKFNNPAVRALYHEFYGAPDRETVLELHTLIPQNFESFMAHLKRLLTFIGHDKNVLYPGRNNYQDIGLHVHLSSPHWNFQNTKWEMIDGQRRVAVGSVLSSLALTLKSFIALEGLRRGDVSTLMNPKDIKVGAASLAPQDYSIHMDAERKDLVALTENTLEIRYFYENVEAELKFYNELALKSPEEAIQILEFNIMKNIDKKTVIAAAKLRPEIFFRLLPPHLWAHLSFSKEELRQIQDALIKEKTEGLVFFDALFTHQKRNASIALSASQKMLYYLSFNRLIEVGNLKEFAYFATFESSNNGAAIVELLKQIEDRRIKYEDYLSKENLQKLIDAFVDLALKHSSTSKMDNSGYKFLVQLKESATHPLVASSLREAFGRYYSFIGYSKSEVLATYVELATKAGVSEKILRELNLNYNKHYPANSCFRVFQ